MLRLVRAAIREEAERRVEARILTAGDVADHEPALIDTYGLFLIQAMLAAVPGSGRCCPTGGCWGCISGLGA